MIADGRVRAEVSKAKPMSDEELEAIIAADPDDEGADVDWSTVTSTLPLASQPVTLELESAVVEFFRKGGAGYETRIAAVLRDYVKAMIERGSSSR